MATRYFNHIACLECGALMPADVMSAGCSQCGSGWIDARFAYDEVAPVWADGLGSRPNSLWRYAELLPVPDLDAEISLEEGFSPLLRLYQYERLYDHTPIFVKDERQGPTSSFKDRQAAVAVTALKQAGIRECVLASTGNAGAAYAAYCARAGIKLWLFLTHQVPAEKMREAALYGAEVVKVSGTYDEVKVVAAEFARRKGLYLDRGARSIPGKESMKTLAFEIAEQLGAVYDAESGRWKAPDWYIQAVSGGIGPLGVWKGFQELLTMGLIDKMPRLGIVQAAGCAPMVQAFHAGKVSADPVQPRTLIHILATGDPGYAYRLLRDAVLLNHGTMLAVEDGEAFAAMRRLASTAGLSVEPATAVAFAGLEKMLYDGIIEAGEVVVINCSGHTFPAESHVLGDQYLLNLERVSQEQTETPPKPAAALVDALDSLDEQMTTVLVVDDNPNDRRLIRRMLKANKNYRVFEAASGKDALRLVDEHVPDLVIADLTMPGMDGLTLIEQLKWSPQTAHVPIVVVSAKSLSTQDRALLERYTESVWTKGDFETQQLVRHIVSALGDTPVDALGSTDRAHQVAEKVLIVDDHPQTVRLLRRWLSHAHDYAVTEAASGQTALRRIYEGHPDIILLDLHLPDMHGIEVIEALRRDAALRQTAVIVYTNDVIEQPLRQRAAELDALLIEEGQFTRAGVLLMIARALSLVRS